MAPLAPEGMHRLVETIGQSAPVDTSAPYDPSGLAGKTVVVTGGASGFGASIARHWASHGAHLILGDVSDRLGEELAAELRAGTGSPHHHYLRCDVADWQSQVDFFRAAARLSPSGRINTVVANAGIIDRDSRVPGRSLEMPRDLDTSARPPPPSLHVIDVNLTGVLYTTHLALFWLARDGAPAAAAAATDAPPPAPAPAPAPSRDRHLLLVSSIAGLMPLPGQALYTTSKHAVVGLFRALRATAPSRHGVRVNMLCPYFSATPLLPAPVLLALAGAGTAAVDDVVDAATRLAADEAIVGRALCVGPRVVVKEGGGGGGGGAGAGEEVEVEVGEAAGPGGDQAVWECYAHDYDSVEVFIWRIVRLMNTLRLIRGWLGFVKDVVLVLLSGGRDRGTASAARRR